MITLRQVTLRRGKAELLKNVDWTIYAKQRFGLIGANGAGKTSLFLMLLGELEPDLGDYTYPKQLKLSHVAQETESTSQTALQYVMDGDVELRDLEARLQKAEEAHDGHAIATLHEKLSIIDAYTAPARAAQLLNGLGFQQADQQQSVSAFSGGWRVRLNLAKALMCRSDVLLLDEPTNHLDLDAVVWLEEWLKHYQGTLIMISHDRDFLDNTVDHIAHIEHQGLKIYSGNYSAFEKQRAADLLIQQAAFEKQQKRLAHLQSFVDRFKAKATKAKQAQSRVKAIEKMDLICAVQSQSPFQFEFREPEQCPNPLLTVEKASISYGTKRILSHLNLTITPKDRIAIVGPNGAGKSSFIKLLAGELNEFHGIREASAGLKIGYFAQHQVEKLHLDDSSILHLRRIAPQSSEVELRTYLGTFGFVGDEVFAPVRQFSGGEKSRLALALLVWQRPNLLLLDEPTNHLDLEMRQALSLALQEYEGAMLLVSHDRFLVRSTTDQLLLVANGELTHFEGDLHDYEQWLLTYRKEQASDTQGESKSERSRKEARQESAKLRELRKPLDLRVKQLEKEILRLEKELALIEKTLSDQSIYDEAQKDKLQVQLINQAKVKKTLESIEEEWLIACEERDNFA